MQCQHLLAACAEELPVVCNGCSSLFFQVFFFYDLPDQIVDFCAFQNVFFFCFNNVCNLEYELTPFLCCCQPAAPAESFWKDVAPLDDVLQVFCPFPCRPAARSLGCFYAALFPPFFMHLEGNLSHFYFVKLDAVFVKQDYMPA